MSKHHTIVDVDIGAASIGYDLTDSQIVMLGVAAGLFCLITNAILGACVYLWQKSVEKAKAQNQAQVNVTEMGSVRSAPSAVDTSVDF